MLECAMKIEIKNIKKLPINYSINQIWVAIVDDAMSGSERNLQFWSKAIAIAIT